MDRKLLIADRILEATRPVCDADISPQHDDGTRLRTTDDPARFGYSGDLRVGGGQSLAARVRARDVPFTRVTGADPPTPPAPPLVEAVPPDGAPPDTVPPALVGVPPPPPALC